MTLLRQFLRTSVVVACLTIQGIGIAQAADTEAGPARTPVELQQRLATARPGATITLAEGEWRDVDLLIDASGTADAPITVAAEEPGKTVFIGRSRLRIAGEHVIVSGLLFREAFHPDAVLEFRRDSKRLASHCRVTECAFVDCNPVEGSREDAKYVSIYGDHNRLDHCHLAGKRSIGTTLVVWLKDATSGLHRIDSNHFGPRPELKRNGGETIRIGDSQTSLLDARCIIESNLFEECNGEAEIISNKSCENIYRHNTFRRCSGALTLRHGERCLVEGNWFLGEKARGSGGVRIIGPGHRVINNYFGRLEGSDTRAAICVMMGLKDSPLSGYAPVESAAVAYNTIVDCKQSIVIGYADEDLPGDIPPRDCVFAANLISSRRGPLIRLLCEPQELQWSRNLLSGAASGLAVESGQILEDPLLKPDADDVARPGRSSPARGAADGLPEEVLKDIDGQRRMPPWDIGCDQLSTDPVQFRPLSAADVGPAWKQPGGPRNE